MTSSTMTATTAYQLYFTLDVASRRGALAPKTIARGLDLLAIYSTKGDTDEQN